MQDRWSGLLELLRYDQAASFSAQATRHLAELSALRPRARDDEPYGRALLHQSAAGELMLAGWGRGARSAPHDHGGACGVVVILEGGFTETTYQLDDGGLAACAERELCAGEHLRAAPGHVHDMRSHDEGLTLHAYVPQIERMRVYDVALRRTLLVSGACGAWLPRRRELIVEEHAWSAAEPRESKP
jgi:predicted metal-dependent enzyme (double-stranded beta helix superfamily)